MLRTDSRHLPRLALLFAIALLVAACDSGDRSTTSSGGGGTWEERFQRGEASAVKDLADQGSQAVSTVNQLLANDSEQVVGMAAMTSKKMGKAGDDTISALFKALKRFPNNAFLVQAIKFRKDAAVPEIVKILKGTNATLQAKAADLLNGLGDKAEPAVDVLLVVLESDAPDATKIQVMGALASIGIPADERARPVLLKVQAAGGKLATYAQRAVRRLDSAHAWKAAREAMAAEEAAKGK